ncbi:single-stranded DNA-binding protein [Desulfonema magnum]|uniref:Single-stranded DNA-binding protein n=1 Tax=Desulfonema magnum TaxID=45655 RepID=A0A975GPE1_9BACT|nr:single-stranded DNA-binding protein [Desulfonema magnum]QTA88752.1 single-stranded DNA-binding protein, helix-destabilizing [Desulfonema magnum]
MAGYCKIILIGNLGRDPEIRYTADGLAVANFSIAVTERIKGEERTQWYRIIAFRKLAEICGEYLSKGKQVYIEGKLQTSEWTDQEGNKRFSLEVVASEMRMLGRKGDSYDNSRPSSAYETPRPSASYDEPEPSAANTQPSAAQRPDAVNEQPADTPESADSGPEEDDIPF